MYDQQLMSERLESIRPEVIVAFFENSIDAAHDWRHHEIVAGNCLEIVAKEGLEVDEEALILAAWLHDYERDDEEANNRFVRELLKEDGLAEKVIGIINEHSYGKEQTTLEAKVLYDADKLEYISIARFKAVTKAVQKGLMKREKVEKYKKAWRERMPVVMKELHFEFTKKEMRRRILRLKESVKDDLIWSDVGLDLERLLGAVV